ncbi:hypothetical protein DEU56DRAFT_226205 [Suillus clintonianus]|uniref:uncharacterized protein n=1 Tax=Suillus clintonianus TaxID=1904413 RepID=UPI001B879C6E|nr:uncharacterized protein DEU56DRAFT_226205 [Suillus clintonianus]KAG2156244.1 hypothetical protein DEU56DRAFT_226205 [Suillus clintonianus]
MANELQMRSPLSRARVAHEEWTQTTDKLRRIGNDFNQIVIDSVDESRGHKNRATEWETRHQDVVAENNDFRAHNEELKRLLELGQPGAGSAIECRDAVYRKLRHVRRVMRELVEDLPDFGDSPNEGASLLLQTEPRDKEISALSSPSGRSRRHHGSSNSSGSSNTARPLSKGKERSSPRTVPISSPASPSFSRASRTGLRDRPFRGSICTRCENLL